MQKIITFLILITIATSSFCNVQNKEIFIKYSHKNVDPGFPDRYIELTANESSSLCVFCTNFYHMTQGQSRSEAVKKTQKWSMYKDYQENKLIYMEKQPQMCVEEPFAAFSWKLQEEYEEVLGYKCQKAICSFRGREYNAWFTTELPFKAAPWKFTGLPGIILKISSSDNSIEMIATYLNLRESLGEIKNPFKKKKVISWEDYKPTYIKFQNEKYEKLSAESVKHGYVTLKETTVPQRMEVIMKENKINDKDRNEIMNKAYSKVGLGN
jgi:GLPGLI family protein